MNSENLIDSILKIKDLNERLLDSSYNLSIRLIKKCTENNISIDTETLS
jgi:hypothetical protein